MIKRVGVTVLLCVLSFPVFAALQAGDSVTLQASAELVQRPVADAGALSMVPAGATLTLVTRAANSGGAWWYVKTGDQRGWMAESALSAPAPAPVAEAPKAPVFASRAPAAPATAMSTDPIPERVMRIAEGVRELELDLDAYQSSFEGVKENIISLYLKYGYFFSSRNELGLTAGYFKATGISSYAVGPFFRLNFPSLGSDTVPFFGLAALYTSTKYDDFGITLKGPEFEASLGLRAFIGESASVNTSLYYSKSLQKYEGYDIDSSAIGLRVGLSGYLR